MNKKNQGFTLVELIIVIVIMGILAAYVTSRFSSLDSGARKTMITTLYSSVKSASTTVHGIAMTEHNVGESGNVKVEGKDVAIARSYAVATRGGIVAALDDSAIDDGTEQGRNKDIAVVEQGNNEIIFQHRGAKDGTKCRVAYKFDASTDVVPVITLDVADCN